MALSARTCGVTLRTQKERDTWKALARQDIKVARQPCRELLHNLGLLQCFDELCEVGQLEGIFTREIVSHHRLTLEFLTTLEVVMEGKAIAAIKFHLRNAEYELSMENLKAIYGITTNEFEMPWAFKNNRFWNDITLETDRFKASRAKSSMIRNPVLRMVQKACNNHPFAPAKTRSVQKDELFLLWCLIHGRPMNMAHYIVKNLERASKRKVGTIRCGAVVGTIARHLGVNTRGYHQDQGPTVLDSEVLRTSHDIGVDYGRNAFFLQREKDNFPLPDPVNTYINGSVDTRNWKMNSLVHQAIIAARPCQRFYDFSPDEYEQLEHVELPEDPKHLMVEQTDDRAKDEEEQPEDADEEIPHHDANEAGTSTQRTRSRQEREEEDFSSLNERMGQMEVRHEEYLAQNYARWAQFKEYNAGKWANINARLDEFSSFWQHPPHPPQ